MRHGPGTHLKPPHHDRVAGRAAYADLDEAGFAKARQSGQGLEARGYRPERAFSSPSTRAIHTAETVLGELTLPGQIELVQDPRLHEQCLGGSEGRKRADVHTSRMIQRYAIEGANLRHPGVNAEGIPAETLNEVIARELAFIASLRGEPEPPETVFVVGHHTAIKGLVAAIELGMSHETAAVDPQILNQGMLDVAAIDTCSTTFIVADGQPDNLRLNVEYVGRVVAA